MGYLKPIRYVGEIAFCPHGLPDGIDCMVCDTDGAAESQGYTDFIKDSLGDGSHNDIPGTLECPCCGSACTECLVCPTCHETKGLECCMPAGVGCPCIACEESEEYE